MSNSMPAPARCQIMTSEGRCASEAAPASLSCAFHLANPPLHALAPPPQPTSHWETNPDTLVPITQLSDDELVKRALTSTSHREARQCHYIRATGRRCGRRAAAASDYCWTHSPEDLKDELLEARDEARAWLISKLDKALLTIVDCMDSIDDRVRLQAACQLLDRSGVTSLTRTQLDAVVTHQTALEPSLAAVDAELERLIARAVNTVTVASRPVDEPEQISPSEPPNPSPPSEPLVIEPVTVDPEPITFDDDAR